MPIISAAMTTPSATVTMAAARTPIATAPAASVGAGEKWLSSEAGTEVMTYEGCYKSIWMCVFSLQVPVHATATEVFAI